MKESVIYQDILQEGIALGKAKGEAKGKAKATRKLTFNLLKAGMDLELISELMELTLPEVKALQKEMEQPNFHPHNP